MQGMFKIIPNLKFNSESNAKKPTHIASWLSLIHSSFYKAYNEYYATESRFYLGKHLISFPSN